MCEGLSHISMVWAEAMTTVGGVRGQFRGLRLIDYTYPDYSINDPAFLDYRLPFEDCGTFAQGSAVEPRRFVVPGMLLKMQDTPARAELIQSIAWLYCAAFLDRAYASFRWSVVNMRCDEDLFQYMRDIRQLIQRFEDSVGLLTCRPGQSQSVVSLLRGVPHLAEAFAQAMQEGFTSLIKPTLIYKDERLRALNIRTEFTALQWLDHLHLACRAALYDTLQFPPLPRLEGNPTEGYTLHLHDLDPDAWQAVSAPPGVVPNQPGALHRTCAG